MSSPNVALDPAVVTAWQAALAAEHQAVFGYGLVLAHLVDNPRSDYATECASAHSTEVTTISDTMLGSDLTPVGPLADYPALYPVASVKDAAALAARLEDACTSARRALFATLTVPTPPNAVTAGPPDNLVTATQDELTNSAVRAARWRRAAGVTPLAVPFPGL